MSFLISLFLQDSLLLTNLHFKEEKKNLAAAFCEDESLQENSISSYHHYQTFSGHIFIS